MGLDSNLMIEWPDLLKFPLNLWSVGARYVKEDSDMNEIELEERNAADEEDVSNKFTG